MKTWWVKFGCLITGWNYNILINCTEASRKQLKKYSSAILILIILWALIGYSFAERYVGASVPGCIITSIIFVVVIVQIERQIILTVGKSKMLGFFRFVIAFIMAILGSAILDQIIFKDDIEKKMIEIVDQQVNEQLPNRIKSFNVNLLEAQTEIDSLEKVKIQLYDLLSRQPVIYTTAVRTSTIIEKQPDGSSKPVTQRVVERIPVDNPKKQELESNNTHLDELRKQKELYIQARMTAEKDLRTELKSKQGFLEELRAIIEILKGRPEALFFYLILFAFLMFLELFVVVSKVGDTKSDYDLIIEYQLSQKRKTLQQMAS
jgi:hypothetical protein